MSKVDHVFGARWGPRIVVGAGAGRAEDLALDGRAPRIIVLENVYGVLTSHAGADFTAIGDALAGAGHSFGAVVIDAAPFVPQSRPRLFIVGALTDKAPTEIALEKPNGAAFHPKALIKAYRKLPADAARRWVWWKLPKPPERKSSLADLIENIDWDTPEQTSKLLVLMSEEHEEKVKEAQRSGRVVIGTAFKCVLVGWQGAGRCTRRRKRHYSV